MSYLLKSILFSLVHHLLFFCLDAKEPKNQPGLIAPRSLAAGATPGAALIIAGSIL
ncbi:hypothetical protein [Paraflavitalea soli]|uniref:hypothetical protein n=1 Tax=Paraflavitalea soli TaxID=2315862 RepID=UPI0013C517EB|nr:hypothetical protein [Paraflavitalea soli]